LEILQLNTNNRYLIILFMLTAFLLAACATATRPTANSILSDQTDAVLTAKLTRFDYRKNLESAVRGESSGLHALFKFTDSKSFVGAGADDHCRTLHELLLLLGDQAFSRELAKESNRVRIAVISALEYDWAYPGWKSSEFPLTYALGKHEQVPTSPF
jgi:hypothetical protein